MKINDMFHYKYKRICVKIKHWARGPLFELYRYLLLITSGCLITYIVYNRLVKERLPVDLNDPVSNIQLSIYSYILFINIILFIVLVAMQIKLYWGNPRHQGFFAQTAEKINDFLAINVFVPIINTYLRLIYSIIPMHYERFLIALFIFFNRLPIIIRISYFAGMLVFPKLIVVTCFLFDVFYNNQLYYFYKVIWLLLLPLWLKFSYGTFRYLYIYAPKRIMKEMNESSEAPSVDLSKAVEKNGLPLSVQSQLAFLDSMDDYNLKKERVKQWYVRLYYRIKADIATFKYNITPKISEAARYTYNLRTYLLLKPLRGTIIVFDSIKKMTYFYLNFAVRLSYIIGWSVVILKQGPFPLSKYYLDQILSHVHALVTFLWTYGTSY